MTCEQCLCLIPCSPSMLNNMYENKAENCPYFKNKADFVEVKHGCLKYDIATLLYECSVCGCLQEHKMRYCGNCGAKMDGGKRE